MAVYMADGERVKTTSDLVEWWVEQASTPRKPGASAERETKSSILAEGDKLYHYGHHFELARIVRTKAGRPKLFVLNGDSSNLSGHYGPSTGERQTHVESLVKKTGVPYITIPFSALGAAGVDISTVKPLEVRPARTERIERESRERPGTLVKMDDPSGATYEHRETRYGWVHKQTGEVWAGPGYSPPHAECYGETAVYSNTQYTHVEQRIVQVDNPNESTVENYGQHAYPYGNAKLGDDGMWRWTLSRHWLGDSLFKGRVTEERMRPASAAEVEAFEEGERWSKRWRELRDIEDAARNTNSNLFFIDRKYEREESLTLGENPPPRPTPEQMAHGDNDVIDAVVAVRAHEHNRPDSVPNAERHRGTGRIIVRHTVRRWAKFLSSFDYNEPHRPYFMCELRYGSPATTVDEAIEDLKPQVIRDALAAGLNVERHGDVFLVPTSLTTDELKSRAVTFEAQRTVEAERWEYDEERGSVHVPAVRETYDEPIRKLRGQGDATVLGTNHSATWVILTNDGDYYVSGTVYHTPTGWGRRPEHRMLKLGKPGQTWYRCVKNTVPLDKSSGSSRGSRWAGRTRIDQSGQSRAWMLGGAVD